MPTIDYDALGQSSTLFSEKNNANPTVLGGGISAVQIVYASVEAEKPVLWVIPASETGLGLAGYFISPKGKV